MNTKQLDKNLHNLTTVVSDGGTISVGGEDTVTISVIGTATSFNLIFEGTIDGSTWFPVAMIDLATFAVSTSTSTKNKLYTTDISALKEFRTRLSAVSGGNITVQAKTIMSR